MCFAQNKVELCTVCPLHMAPNLGGGRSILVGDKTTLESDKLDRSLARKIEKKYSVAAAAALAFLFAERAREVAASFYICNRCHVVDLRKRFCLPNRPIKGPIIVMLD